MTSVVNYYGSKTRQVDKIIKHLPADRRNWHYVEVFGGSAATLLAIDPPFKIETYNDLDSEAVTFFRVLRNDADELVRQIRYTPFSREENALARSPDTPEQPDIERARRFFVRAMTMINANTALGSKPDAGGSWNMKIAINSARASDETIQNRLYRAANRLKHAQIENRDALRVIGQYDSPSTVFYCDPPYLHSTRKANSNYMLEYSDDDHRQLAAALNGISGRAIVSGYHSTLYGDLYRNWRFVEHDVVANSAASMIAKRSGQGEIRRTEVLWMNFEPDNPPLLAEWSGQ